MQHVIVDEAQDMSPMQWRAVRRRLTGGAVTLLGDLAQGARPWSPYSWEAVIEALELSAVRYGELQLNYRVPAPIAEYADTILRRIDVVSAPVRHLRSGEPVVWETLTDWLASSQDVANRLHRFVDEVDGSVGVIAPSCHHRRLEEALRDAGEDLRCRVTLLDPAEAKGLEFDNVVVIDPDAIERLPRGERLLYVAVTRATKRLVMVANRRELDQSNEFA
ncbi:MAG TPA: ATP-binding domain-containing protein [Rhodothermales bacterium]